MFKKTPSYLCYDLFGFSPVASDYSTWWLQLRPWTWQTDEMTYGWVFHNEIDTMKYFKDTQMIIHFWLENIDSVKFFSRRISALPTESRPLVAVQVELWVFTSKEQRRLAFMFQSLVRRQLRQQEDKCVILDKYEWREMINLPTINCSEFRVGSDHFTTNLARNTKMPSSRTHNVCG